MAAKNGVTDKKRKASGTMKNASATKPKKARVEEKPAAPVEDDADSFGDFSEDDEEGGVQLDQKPPKRSSDSSKTFEKEAGQTSREAHAKQKQLALERKAAKPLADEVARIKQVWEKLRLKTTVTEAERKAMVDELLGIFRGRMREFTLKHDTVRAVQSAIKYASSEQKKEIAKELKGSFVQLAESKYAKFLIGKLLVQGEDEIRDLIIPEFYGKVRKMINHPEASWILDDIYRTVATEQQKAMLLREWYGPEFAIQEMADNTDPTADLKQILEKEPGKRSPIMQTLFKMINSLVQKGSVGFTILHDAMLQYFLNTQTDSNDFTEFGELVKGDESSDLLKNMAFTKSGSRVASLLIAHGTAKDRKAYLKAYKDTFQQMATDQYGHLVILTAYDVIDDTKLTAKSIFSELLGEGEEQIAQNVVALLSNSHGKKSLLYPFEGLSGTLFFKEPAYITDLLKEVHEIRKTSSKKDTDVRQKELINTVSPHLINVITASASDLLATAEGAQLILDVMFFGQGDKEPALEAIAVAAGGDPSQESETSPHVARTPFGARMVKSLIQGGPYNKEAGKVMPVEPSLNFSNIFYPHIKDHVMEWATIASSASFVIVALLESSEFDNVEEVKQTLKENKAQLEAAKGSEQGDANSNGNKTGGRRRKAKKPMGNAGVKVLLEAL